MLASPASHEALQERPRGWNPGVGSASRCAHRTETTEASVSTQLVGHSHLSAPSQELTGIVGSSDPDLASAERPIWTTGRHPRPAIPTSVERRVGPAYHRPVPVAGTPERAARSPARTVNALVASIESSRPRTCARDRCSYVCQGVIFGFFRGWVGGGFVAGQG